MDIGIYIGSTEDEVFYNGKLHNATRANNLLKPPLLGNWVKITAPSTETCGLLIIDILKETDALPLVTRNLKGLLKTKDSLIVLPSSIIWSQHFGQIADKMKTAATLQKDQSYTASLTWNREKQLFELLKSSDAQWDAQNAYQTIFKKYEAENSTGARAISVQPAAAPVEVKNKERNTMAEEDEWVTGVIVKHSFTGRDLVIYNEKYRGVVVKYQQHTVITINKEAIRPTAGMLARFTLKKGHYMFEPEPQKVERYRYRADKVDYLTKDNLQEVVEHQRRSRFGKKACTFMVDAMARYDGVHFVVYTKGPPKERLLIAIDPHGCVQEPDRRTEYSLRLACFYRNEGSELMWKVIAMLGILSQNASLLERVAEFDGHAREESTESGKMEARANLRSSLQGIGLNAPMAPPQRFAGPNIESQRPAQATKVTEKRASLSDEQCQLMKQLSPAPNEAPPGNVKARNSGESSSISCDDDEGDEILKPAYVSEKWKHHKSDEGWHYGLCYTFYDRVNKQEQLKVISTSNQRFMASYPIRDKNKVMGHWIEFKERGRFAEQMTVSGREDFPKCRLMLKHIEIELELTYKSAGKGHLFENDLIGEVTLPDFGGKYSTGATYLHWFLVDMKMYPARSEFPRVKNVMTDCQWGTGEYSDSEDMSDKEIAEVREIVQIAAQNDSVVVSKPVTVQDDVCPLGGQPKLTKAKSNENTWRHGGEDSDSSGDVADHTVNRSNKSSSNEPCKANVFQAAVPSTSVAEKDYHETFWDTLKENVRPSEGRSKPQKERTKKTKPAGLQWGCAGKYSDDDDESKQCKYTTPHHNEMTEKESEVIVDDNDNCAKDPKKNRTRSTIPIDEGKPMVLPNSTPNPLHPPLLTYRELVRRIMDIPETIDIIARMASAR